MEKPTVQELIGVLMHSSKGQDKLGKFVSSNIGECQSSLVDALLAMDYDKGGLTGFSYDDITNLYKPFEAVSKGDCVDCSDSHELNENGLCEDCFNDNNEAQEIFEWWTVDKYTATKLESEGEPILDNDYGIWWGRTTTGQAIKMDYVIAKMYATREIEYWSEEDQKEYEELKANQF